MPHSVKMTQPGKSPKVSKNKPSNSKSMGHLAVDYDAHVPTLSRYTKFNTSTSFNNSNSSSPVLNEKRQVDTQPTQKFSSSSTQEQTTEAARTTKIQNQFNETPNGQSVVASSTASTPTLKIDSIVKNQQLNNQSPVVDEHQDHPNMLSKSENIHRRMNSFAKENRRSGLHRSSTSSSSSGKSSISKVSDKIIKSNGIINSSHYQSCPDLLKPCLSRYTSYDSGLSSTLSRHKFSKSEKYLYKQKPLAQWTLDDALLWLQSVGLEDVTSVLIGYELNGSDILQWNDQSLKSLGISDQQKRIKVLNELQKLKISQSSNRNSPKKQSSQRYCSLFSMVSRSQYDRIMVIELPPSTSVRDFTVATDPLEMALVVTSCKSVAELQKGDLIIELNGVSCVKLPPVDFNKLLHELNGHKYQMVILRKSVNGSSIDNGDESNQLQQISNVFHL